MPRATPRLLIVALALLALAAALASLLVGPARLGPARTLAALAGQGDAVADAILFELRLPRMLLALLVGGVLGLAGAALQGLLRNPLAEPGVLGTSGAAAFGAVVALYFGFAALSPFLLPLFAILGALAALVALLLLGGRDAEGLSLILAGIAISALAGAGVSLALNLAPNPFAAMEIMGWLMGSLENRSRSHLWLAVPPMVVGATLLLLAPRALDALTLGEDVARSMGVDPAGLRLRLLAGVALGVGGAVAVAGAIGFVGLIVPHLVRPFTDRSPSALLWPSLLAGAALLTLADVAVRLIPTATELRLGVVTAFLGVPVFLAQLARARRP